MTKTTAAFLLTADRLFADKTQKVYFWTFTFCVVHDDWEASSYFASFLNHLRKVIGGDWGGVRVVELHRDHGCHYHALINRRLAVDIVRRVARCHAIGRIFVELADADAAAYMGKYLSKQCKGPLTKSGRNARRWAAFGPVARTRVSDLVNDSPEWVYRREHNLPFVSYRYEALLSSCWVRGEVTFRTAWHCAKRGEMGNVLALAHGQLQARGRGEMVERADWDVAAQPF